MKKNNVLLVSSLVLGMIFTSCSKDNSTITSASIEGKWNFNKTSITQSGITSPEVDYSGNQAGCSKDYIDILASGVVNSGDYISGCSLVTDSGTWSKTGNSVIVSVPSIGMTGTFEVVRLTTTELKLKITTTQNTVTFTVNQSFTRG